MAGQRNESRTPTERRSKARPEDALSDDQIERIKLALMRRGLSQAWMAQQIGTSEPHLAQILKGTVGVKKNRLQQLAGAFGWTVSQLLGEQELSGDDTPARSRPAGSGGEPPVGNARLEPESGARWPVYRWGLRDDPRRPEVAELRRESPRSDQLEKIGPTSYAIEVTNAANGAMTAWDEGIVPGVLCWVNPERAWSLGTTVAAVITTPAQEGGPVGLVVAEYGVDDNRAEALYHHYSQPHGRILVARGGQFYVVGRVVYVDTGFTPL